MPIRNLIVLAPSGFVLFEKGVQQGEDRATAIARLVAHRDDRVRGSNHSDAPVVHRDVVLGGDHVPRR